MRNILFHFGFEGACLLKEGEGVTEERNNKKERSFAGKAFTEGMGREVKWSLHTTQPSQAVQMF